jgi:hypothetical protein
LVTALTKVEVSDATATINDADAAALNAEDLSAIGGATTGTVTVTNAVAITGTQAELTAALVTGGTKVEVDDPAVTLTTTPTIAALNLIAAETTGVVTATLAADSLANLGALTTAGTDAITITVNDGNGSTLAATDLSTLGGKTAATATVSNAVVISGTRAQVTAELVTAGA